MSEETCAKCGRPYAHSAHQEILESHCPDSDSFGCLRSQLSAATARASELETVCDAWRKLAEWSGRADRTVSVGYFALEATEGGKQVGVVRFGQFPSQAAIDLATKLGLLQPEKEGTTDAV